MHQQQRLFASLQALQQICANDRPDMSFCSRLAGSKVAKLAAWLCTRGEGDSPQLRDTANRERGWSDRDIGQILQQHSSHRWLALSQQACMLSMQQTWRVRMAFLQALQSMSHQTSDCMLWSKYGSMEVLRQGNLQKRLTRRVWYMLMRLRSTPNTSRQTTPTAAKIHSLRSDTNDNPSVRGNSITRVLGVSAHV